MGEEEEGAQGVAKEVLRSMAWQDRKEGWKKGGIKGGGSWDKREERGVRTMVHVGEEEEKGLACLFVSSESVSRTWFLNFLYNSALKMLMLKGLP